AREVALGRVDDELDGVARRTIAKDSSKGAERLPSAQMEASEVDEAKPPRRASGRRGLVWYIDTMHEGVKGQAEPQAVFFSHETTGGRPHFGAAHGAFRFRDQSHSRQPGGARVRVVRGNPVVVEIGNDRYASALGEGGGEMGPANRARIGEDDI